MERCFSMDCKRRQQEYVGKKQIRALKHYFEIEFHKFKVIRLDDQMCLLA